jgi:acid phosphatase type 7
MIRLFSLCLAVLIFPCAESIGQIIGPYLQSPSDTSVWITWKTSANPESIVLYGSDPDSLQQQVNGDCQVLSDAGYNNNYFYHSVRLTGLKPDQFYYYRVITGTLRSSVLRFRTQPVPGVNPGIYRVLILGDHQIKSNDRYERLMTAARQKVQEKYGGTIEEHISLIINDGDQVDQGTLDQYEFVHFKPSSVLSGNIPVMTTVGNHETYGTLGLTAYYQHFYYDGPGYKGIISPGGENYYSYQQGSIVFVHLSSEHPTGAQVSWVQQIVDSVKSDPSVNWMVSIAHRPIQAEQYVGDISEYIRDQVVPILATTEKSTLLITGHHHLYARGQLRDFPMYHIISGGASWDQFWGQSTEKDFDDVQKTIDYWAYQIASFDDVKGEMTVESYAIGSPKLGLTLDNLLIDSFYRKKDAVPPARPSINTVPADTITLPFTFESSPYSTQSAEPLNSTQFQISLNNDFSSTAVDLIRDYENLYGTTGSPDFRPVDIHENTDILQYSIGRNKLPDGTYFIRTRQRDRNMEWSAWSEPVEFSITGSVTGFTRISTPRSIYEPGGDIRVDYEFGPGNAKDWIGIYKYGETPGPTPSTDWEYTTGSSGSVNLQVSAAGKYFIGFFENDGYQEMAERISVYIGKTPVISLSKAGYEAGEIVEVSYTNAPGFTNDWIGIYKSDDVPGIVGSTKWSYTSGASGNLSFSGLTRGYYFISYFLEDQYTEAGERVIFSVGSDLAQLTVGQSTYLPGQPVGVDFKEGPGTSADWIGIFRQNPPPGTAPLADRKFISDQKSGSLIFDLLLEAGTYYAALFINNSNVRISNKAIFSVQAGNSSLADGSETVGFIVSPSPSKGRFTLKTSGLPGNIHSLQILSVTGELVLEKEYQSGTASIEDEIDITGSPAGLYLVNLRTGNHLFIKRIVIE